MNVCSPSLSLLSYSIANIDSEVSKSQIFHPGKVFKISPALYIPYFCYYVRFGVMFVFYFPDIYRQKSAIKIATQSKGVWFAVASSLNETFSWINIIHRGQSFNFGFVYGFISQTFPFVGRFSVFVPLQVCFTCRVTPFYDEDSTGVNRYSILIQSCYRIRYSPEGVCPIWRRISSQFWFLFVN